MNTINSIEWNKINNAKRYTTYWYPLHNPFNIKEIEVNPDETIKSLKDFNLKKGSTYIFKVMAFGINWELTLLDNEMIYYKG